MTPSLLDIVSAFEVDQRQKNAAAKAEADKLEAEIEADFAERDRILNSILDELAPALERAAKLPGGALVKAFSGKRGSVLFINYNDSRHVMVLRVTRTPAGLIFIVGKGIYQFSDVVIDGVSTTDITEFKVLVAQRLGVILANGKAIAP